MCYDCILCHTLETSCITTDKHNSREILLYCPQFRRINSKNRVLLVLKKKYKKFWNDWYNYRKKRKQSMQFNACHICEIYRQIKLSILIYIYGWDHININIYLYFFKKKKKFRSPKCIFVYESYTSFRSFIIYIWFKHKFVWSD